MNVKRKIVARDHAKGIVDRLKDLATGNPTIGDISPAAKKILIPKRKIEINARKSSQSHQRELLV